MVVVVIGGMELSNHRGALGVGIRTILSKDLTGITVKTHQATTLISIVRLMVIQGVNTIERISKNIKL